MFVIAVSRRSENYINNNVQYLITRVSTQVRPPRSVPPSLPPKKKEEEEKVHVKSITHTQVYTNNYTIILFIHAKRWKNIRQCVVYTQHNIHDF